MSSLKGSQEGGEEKCRRENKRPWPCKSPWKSLQPARVGVGGATAMAARLFVFLKPEAAISDGSTDR